MLSCHLTLTERTGVEGGGGLVCGVVRGLRVLVRVVRVLLLVLGIHLLLHWVLLK